MLCLQGPSSALGPGGAEGRGSLLLRGPQEPRGRGRFPSLLLLSRRQTALREELGQAERTRGGGRSQAAVPPPCSPPPLPSRLTADLQEAAQPRAPGLPTPSSHLPSPPPPRGQLTRRFLGSLGVDSLPPPGHMPAHVAHPGNPDTPLEMARGTPPSPGSPGVPSPLVAHLWRDGLCSLSPTPFFF